MFTRDILTRKTPPVIGNGMTAVSVVYDLDTVRIWEERATAMSSAGCWRQTCSAPPTEVDARFLRGYTCHVRAFSKLAVPPYVISPPHSPSFSTSQAAANGYVCLK